MRAAFGHKMLQATLRQAATSTVSHSPGAQQRPNFLLDEIDAVAKRDD